MRNLFSIFVYFLLFFSCQLDRVEVQNWTPNLIVPLIDATITISNLIPEEGSTQYDEDGFLRLAVRNDSLYSLNANSFIDIPNQSAVNQSFNFENFPIQDFYQDTTFNIEDILISNPSAASLLGISSLPFPPDTTFFIPGVLFNLVNQDLLGVLEFQLDDFSEASFNEGQLEVEIYNNLPITIESAEIILSTGIGEVGIINIFDLQPQQNQTIIIDLSNNSINNSISANFVDFSLENLGSELVPLTSQTSFGISFGLTNINVNNITMAFQNQEIESYNSFIDFNLSNDEQIHNITLSDGQISYEINSSLTAPVDLVFGIPSGLLNDESFEVTESIVLNGETVYGTIDLSGLEIDLTTDSSQPFNRVPISLQVSINSDDVVTLNSGDFANIICSFSDLKLDYLDGYFSNYNIELGGDTVDVDLALFEDFDSGLILEDPKLVLNVINSMGISAAITGFLTGYSQDGLAQASFAIDSIIHAPNIIGEEVYMSWVYDKSVIGDIISLPPKLIDYSANASILDNQSLNFLTSSSKLILGVEIDFPLSVSAANISLKDTIPFSEIQYNVSQIDDISLHFNLLNGFPLGTKFNLLLYDSVSMINLDTLSFIGFNAQDNTIAPASVDLDGYVVNNVLSSGSIELSSSEISNLLNSNMLIIDITLSTSNSNLKNQYVKLYSDYEFIVKMGIETHLLIN